MIPISFHSPRVPPSPHYIINEIDSEMMALSFNIIIMVITLAFSSYFLLCFGNVIYVNDDEESAAVVEPTKAEDSIENLDLQFIEQEGMSDPLLSADFSGYT